MIKPWHVLLVVLAAVAITIVTTLAANRELQRQQRDDDWKIFYCQPWDNPSHTATGTFVCNS